MHYWLFKSEPTTFSIDDLSRRPRQTEHWDGVRNYQVRNMLRDEIKKGDLAFFYHSSCTPPGIAGVVEIVKEAYPDPSALDVHSKYYDPLSSLEKPRWYMVDVKLVEKFPRLIRLSELKQHAVLDAMLILRKGNRLSITPMIKPEWQAIMRIIKKQ